LVGGGANWSTPGGSSVPAHQRGAGVGVWVRVPALGIGEGDGILMQARLHGPWELGGRAHYWGCFGSGAHWVAGAQGPGVGRVVQQTNLAAHADAAGAGEGADWSGPHEPRTARQGGPTWGRQGVSAKARVTGIEVVGAASKLAIGVACPVGTAGRWQSQETGLSGGQHGWFLPRAGRRRSAEAPPTWIFFSSGWANRHQPGIVQPAKIGCHGEWPITVCGIRPRSGAGVSASQRGATARVGTALPRRS